MQSIKQYIKHITLVDIINFFLICFAIGFSFYLMHGSHIFGDTPQKRTPDWYTYLFFGLSFAFLCGAIVFNVFKKHYRPTWIFVILLSLVFITNLIATFIFRESSTYYVLVKGTPRVVIYTLSLTSKLCFSLQFFGVLAVVFLTFDLIPKCLNTQTMINLLCLGGIILALVTVIYSYFSDAEFYVTLASKMFSKNPEIVYPKSFFPNKNSFAFIIFIGFASCLFLINYKGGWWWYIFATYFLMSILLSFCKSLMIITPLLYLAFLIYRFIYTFKEHKKRNIIATSIIAFFIFASIISIFIVNLLRPNLFGSISKTIIEEIPYTLSSRINLWNNLSNLTFNYNVFSGLGYHNNNFLVFSFMQLSVGPECELTSSAHNAFMEIFSSGGIILTIVFFLLFAYFIYLIVKLFKSNKSLVIFIIILSIALIAIGMVESCSFIMPYSMDYAFFIGITVLPLSYKKRSLDKVLFR